MPKKLIRLISGTVCLFSILSLTSSCRHRSAGFMASSREEFEHQRSIPRKLKEETLPLINIKTETDGSETVEYLDELPVVEIPGSAEALRSAVIEKKVTQTRIKQPEKKYEKEKPKKKKKRAKRPQFNDGLKIGTLFLGIAIIMGIFSLTQLTLLFGLVSILFLYFGLKKYFRQKRRRNIFKKNN